MAFVVTKPITIQGIERAVGDRIEHLEAEVALEYHYALTRVQDEVKEVQAYVKSAVLPVVDRFVSVQTSSQPTSVSP